MDVLHVHVIKHVVHVLQGHRSTIEKRDEGVEVFLLFGSKGEEGSGFVDLAGTGGERWALGPAFEFDLFVGFDRAEGGQRGLVFGSERRYGGDTVW
jgi:hypothetical protein